MVKIILSFNISSRHYGYGEAAELRREISMRLDTALKDAGVGKWSGGTSKFDILEIYLNVTDPDKATDIVKSALADHWLFPLMEIRRQSRRHPMDKSP